MVSALCIIAVSATFAGFSNAATDYCNLKTCEGADHTICKYGFLNVNHKRCGKPKTASLTSAEIKKILGLHNSYRAIVASGREHRGHQPAATNLRPLKWDQELARIAQSWADQCTFKHDPCRDSQRFQVGQNIGYKSSTADYEAKFTDIVTMWYDEVENFDRNQVKSLTNMNGVGHYTQMMWADTKYLGCGGVRYQDGPLYKSYLVCNYGPTGNWYGEEMYKTQQHKSRSKSSNRHDSEDDLFDILSWL